MTTLTVLALTVLADDTPRNTGPDFGKASPFGLLVLVLLFIGVFFLVWSMNRHLNKLPESFDSEHQEPVPSADGTADGPAEASGDPADPAQEPGGQPTG